MALNFSDVDRAFLNAESRFEYRDCRETLEQMLPEATTDADRASVHWRISRICVLLGDYEDGIEHANEAIRLNPSDEHGYMWHCANVGRECQRHSLTVQATKVPTMEKDLNTILNKLGKTRYSEAWQALAELYDGHPLKSGDAAINYARRAVVTIPKSELRMQSWLYLATLLNRRGWSAEKKERQRDSHRDDFANTKKKNTDRYAYYDGAPAGEWPWASYGMSDKEEALSILNYAVSLYESRSSHVRMDIETYNQILDTIRKWK